MLLYILNGTSGYLYHFERVTMCYHQIFNKEVYITFFIKLTVTRGNVLKMVQLSNYSFQDV